MKEVAWICLTCGMLTFGLIPHWFELIPNRDGLGKVESTINEGTSLSRPPTWGIFGGSGGEGGGRGGTHSVGWIFETCGMLAFGLTPH